MARKLKRIDESRTVLAELMLPGKANPAGNVHGGEVMKIMDSCAGVTARRHAKTNVVTVRVDELIFHEPVKIGQLLICESHLVYVGRTSMEIKVTVKVEDLQCDEPPKTALSAFFTFVALDSDGKPTEVPGLLLETEEQKKAFEEGRMRHLEYKKRRIEP